jgi:3-oxoadipate enol-lactonase
VKFVVDGPERAPALVLSNALGTTLELWEPQLPELARRFRVIRYDHRPRDSVAALAAGVLELADALGVGRFSLCGLSLGGMVGMWLGAEAPARVDRLVLVSTSARFGSPAEWHERAARVRAEGMEAVADDALDKWFTPKFRARGRYREMQLAMPPDDYAAGLEAIAGFDFRGRLGEIGAPTLVVAAAGDVATPPEAAQQIADGIPGARLVVLDGAAHLANVEQPAAFTTVVVDHLTRRRSAA